MKFASCRRNSAILSTFASMETQLNSSVDQASIGIFMKNIVTIQKMPDAM